MIVLAVLVIALSALVTQNIFRGLSRPPDFPTAEKEWEHQWDHFRTARYWWQAIGVVVFMVSSVALVLWWWPR